MSLRLAEGATLTGASRVGHVPANEAFDNRSNLERILEQKKRPRNRVA